MIPIPSLSQIKAAAVFVLVLIACLTTHKCTADGYKLQMERKDRAAAEALVRAEQKARKQEQDWSAAFDVAATLNMEAVNDVRTQKDRIIAGLRAGRLSFRPGCPVPEAAADSGPAQATENSGQPGLVGEAITERFAVCDEVVHERNICVGLMESERR